jgi:hypothetical protein
LFFLSFFLLPAAVVTPLFPSDELE